ncbi:MAG: XkdX family protein [Clostridia bacterium]|nr:XkdX family protein [Clostridia bacterium]
MFSIIKMKYQAKKITAAEVWAYADAGKITEAEAIKICGPRPKG